LCHSPFLAFCRPRSEFDSVLSQFRRSQTGIVMVYIRAHTPLPLQQPSNTSKLLLLTWRTLSGLKSGRSLFAGHPAPGSGASPVNLRSFDAHSQDERAGRLPISLLAGPQCVAVDRKRRSKRVWAISTFEGLGARSYCRNQIKRSSYPGFDARVSPSAQGRSMQTSGLRSPLLIEEPMRLLDVSSRGQMDTLHT
jgi:hypothetical protein